MILMPKNSVTDIGHDAENLYVLARTSVLKAAGTLRTVGAPDSFVTSNPIHESGILSVPDAMDKVRAGRLPSDYVMLVFNAHGVGGTIIDDGVSAADKRIFFSNDFGLSGNVWSGGGSVRLPFSTEGMSREIYVEAGEVSAEKTYGVVPATPSSSWPPQLSVGLHRACRYSGPPDDIQTTDLNVVYAVSRLRMVPEEVHASCHVEDELFVLTPGRTLPKKHESARLTVTQPQLFIQYTLSLKQLEPLHDAVSDTT